MNQNEIDVKISKKQLNLEELIHVVDSAGTLNKQS
jgi:hypothetical protein